MSGLRPLALLLVLSTACNGAQKKAADRETPPAPAKPTEITLFFTTELKGTIEPCGCTSDPMGDLARTARVIESVPGAALIDGGSTLYSETTLSPGKEEQERRKAKLIAETLLRLGLVAAGLGPYDQGDDGGLPRLAANLPRHEGTKLVDIRGAKVGIFGVTEGADPTAAARRAIAELRAGGAQVVVGIAHLPRAEARKLAREAPGADLILVGKDAPDPDRPLTPVEPAGEAFLLQAHDRGQSILRLDLRLDPAGGPLTDAIGAARAQARIEKLDAQIADLAARIAAFEKDPTADPAFVQTKRDELAARKRERDELARDPVRAPAKGSWFTAELLPIKKGLPCDAEVQAAKQAYDRAVGEANRARFAGEQPPAAPAGAAHYVGGEECGYCHAKAVEFWKTTKHAAAWETLERAGKQWNRDCIGCHVTGWLEPGGSAMGNVADAFVDVQCEVCHGPGSRHVDADGKEKKPSLQRAPEERRCVQCHSPEHSDTFQYEAYLRDVTGPGHGEAFRKQLGEGPTGAELRKAALEKAGAGVGEGCAK